MANEVEIFSPGGELMPGAGSGMNLLNYQLSVKSKGKVQGWCYGYGDSAQMLDEELDMIIVFRRSHRRLFGVPNYDESLKLKAWNPVVCRSADGQTARGIGRPFTEPEKNLVTGDTEDYSWAGDIRDGLSCDGCPVGDKSELWLCRRRVFYYVLIRSKGGEGVIEWWSPAIYDVAGVAVKPFDDAWDRLGRATMQKPMVVDGQRKQSVSYRFVQSVSLEAIPGRTGYKPIVTPPLTLADADFEEVHRTYFAGDPEQNVQPMFKKLVNSDYAHDLEAMQWLGKPRERRDNEDEASQGDVDGIL